MKRSQILLVAIVGLFIASTATAYLLLGQTGAVTLPDNAFTDKTFMAMVIDLDQSDGQTAETIKTTVADAVDSFNDLLGQKGAVSPGDLAEFNEAVDRFFKALADHEVQAFAVTMEMDLNEMIRNGGEGPMPEPVMTLLVKAGQAPDLVAMASDITGKEMPAEMAEKMAADVMFEPLSGGWYAISSKDAPPMIRVPSGQGDAAVAAKFNKALAHSSGGLLQVAMVLPEDAANAMAGKMAADMPDDAPEPIREAVRTISDLQSISYALDVEQGIGLRYYVVYENADAAKRMMQAYGGIIANWPAMLEAANAASPISEEDKKMFIATQEKMAGVMDLMEISREGETITIELDEESFDKMIEIMTDAVASSLPGA